MFKKLILLGFALSLIGFGGCGQKSGSSSLTLSNSTPITNPGGLLNSAILPKGDLPNKSIERIFKGGLKGKTIVLSPGHGRTWKSTGWYWQRPYMNGVQEDYHDNELTMDYLIPYLSGAGGRVISVRERSRQTNELILDNEDGSPTYTETGSWATTAATTSGYNGKAYRYIATDATETATAVYRPNIPESGFYPVYIWYKESTNRVKDALYKIVHSGGTTAFYVDQTQEGSRWIFLGEFYFEKGQSCAVILSNKSASSGYVIADAVRVGAGIGKSGYPRWLECAQEWVNYMGGSHLSGYGDVNIRGQYADWRGGDAYLMIHSNAGGGRGTSTFIHDTSPSAGSEALRTIMHSQLIKDIRAHFDPVWKDRGKHFGNYGELRNTNTMPAVLLEFAFHDDAEDGKYIRNARFRKVMCRSLYKAFQRHLNPTAPITPLEPTVMVAKNSGPGAVTLQWQAPVDPLEPTASATSYVIYVSNNGHGFDNGVEVTGTSHTITNLTPGAVYYFRIAAANAGGLGLPSETLAVRVTPNGEAADILIVNGFDRLDEVVVNTPDRANSFNYSIQHGSSIARAGSFFDGATNDAVEKGLVKLNNYKILDWISGEESTQDETFSSAEQQLISAYLQGGGSLLASGSEIAWDLGAQGSTSDKDFLANTLQATYGSDDADTYSASGVSGSAFDGLGSFNFDDGNGGTYDVNYPDVLKPSSPAQSCLTYSNGKVAGIQYSGAYKLIYLGFPLETVTSEAARDQLFKKAIEFLK